MSDHVDGDTPAPARDAAGGRLTDEQAACLAAYLAGGNGPDAGLGMAVQMDIVDAGDDDVEALARVVLAWRPAVAAARALVASGIGHWAAEEWATPDGEDRGVECGKCRAQWYQGGPDGNWYCDHRPGCVAAALDAALAALDGAE